MNPVLTSSGSTHWQTPEHILDMVRAVGPIHYDPATTADNPTGAAIFSYQDEHGCGWTGDEPVCGLGFAWPESGLVFCNPPYGQQLNAPKVYPHKTTRKGGVGVGWATKMSLFRGEGIYLCPANTDTAAFHRLLRSSDVCVLMQGRLTFKGAGKQAPFGSALYYRGPRWRRFMDVFTDLGTIVPSPKLTTTLMERAREST